MIAPSEEDARSLHAAVRDALRGRGRSRREAESILLEEARRVPTGLIPVVLAVRDEVARETPAPRGLARRVDQILLAIADGSAPDTPPAERGRNGNGNGNGHGKGNGRNGSGKSENGKKAAAAPPAKSRRSASAGRRGSRPVRRAAVTTFGRAGLRAGRLLRQLLDLSPDAVLTIRASGRIGIWNMAGAAITGRRRGQLLRTGVRALFQDPETIAALLAEVDGGTRTLPRETMLLRQDGGGVPVRVFAAPLVPHPDARDDPDRYLLFLHDLTEVHQIRSRLIETEKLSAMAKIAGSVAHEFRNPLNSLFLSADLLEDELEGLPGAGEAIAPTLAAIREEIERLNLIINHYLALSKVESSTPEIVDLGAMVRAFADEWRERAAEADVDLRVKVHDGVLAVSADPNQLRRVLVNLLDNAFDALTPEDEDEDERPRSPHIKLSVRPMRRSVKLTVRDNGSGIPEDVRTRVFDPFFTSKSRGSGLGLYLVREIVLAHGGGITIGANGGRGTAVVTHWPYPQGEESS